jgi:predicted DNA-binding transcriptional regulator AlpA
MPLKDPNSPFIDAVDVAHLLGKSFKWVYQKKKLIPGLVSIGKSYF